MIEAVMKQYVKSLKQLSGILDKGAAFADMKKIEFDVLANSRLAPDQFNLIRQVQIACDAAARTAARLAAKEPPAHEDTEKTLPELKTRITKAISYIEGIKASDYQGWEERRVSQPRWEGKSLSGLEFLMNWSIPNVYFHITTAYSILRHNGVDVGKKDFLGEMPYRS